MDLLAIVITGPMMALLAAATVAPSLLKFISDYRQGTNQRMQGKQMIDLQKRQMENEQKATRAALRTTQKSTADLTKRLTADKQIERDERRLERMDYRRMNSEDRNLQILSILGQAIGNMGDARLTAQQMMTPPPPMALSTLLRRRY